MFKRVLPFTQKLKFWGTPGVDGSIADMSVVASEECSELLPSVDPPHELRNKTVLLTGKLDDGHEGRHRG